jgi:hypothetical protein
MNRLRALFRVQPGRRRASTCLAAIARSAIPLPAGKEISKYAVDNASFFVDQECRAALVPSGPSTSGALFAIFPRRIAA